MLAICPPSEYRPARFQSDSCCLRLAMVAPRRQSSPSGQIGTPLRRCSRRLPAALALAMVASWSPSPARSARARREHRSLPTDCCWPFALQARRRALIMLSGGRLLCPPTAAGRLLCKPGVTTVMRTLIYGFTRQQCVTSRKPVQARDGATNATLAPRAQDARAASARRTLMMLLMPDDVSTDSHHSRIEM